MNRCPCVSDLVGVGAISSSRDHPGSRKGKSGIRGPVKPIGFERESDGWLDSYTCHGHAIMAMVAVRSEEVEHLVGNTVIVVSSAPVSALVAHLADRGP